MTAKNVIKAHADAIAMVGSSPAVAATCLRAESDGSVVVDHRPLRQQRCLHVVLVHHC